MGAATIRNLLGTTVSQQYASKNLDSSQGFGTRTGGVGAAIGYIYGARPFPLGATITKAEIHFFSTSMPTGTHTFNFRALRQSFSSSKVNYTSRPTLLSADTKTVTKTGVIADGTEWTVNIQSWMQAVSDGTPWYGIQFQSAENVARYFYAENNPKIQFRPYLLVEWSDAPDKPSGLSPAGGRAVGLSKPVLRAHYVDVSGDTNLAAVQVQINATADFTTPAWDSGVVLTSSPELNLANTAYAGLTDGQTVYWRLRFQDGAGLWSSWADPVSFKYDTKGTLVVNNPPVGTPTVSDVTPPILWDFTGETQAAYQLTVVESFDPTNSKTTRKSWTSGKITSNDTSITLPSGVLTQSGKNYDLSIRVWDAKSREATPGDPAYVEVVRTFSFVPSAATAGTTGLTAVPQDPRPYVQLSWSRATAPDGFNIVRNGKVIAAGLLPENVNTGSTTYTWTDHSASPQRTLTYSVQAVVNGIASSSNTTATAVVKSMGIWLRDSVTGDELVIAGRDARSFTLSETSEMLTPIADGANKVLISQAQGGLEGTIQGVLTSGFPGTTKTAQQWRDVYLKMRNNAGRKFYLTTGDYTMLVVARNFTYSQRTIPEPQYEVSFEFYQQDSVDSLTTGY